MYSFIRCCGSSHRAICPLFNANGLTIPMQVAFHVGCFCFWHVVIPMQSDFTIPSPVVGCSSNACKQWLCVVSHFGLEYPAALPFQPSPTTHGLCRNVFRLIIASIALALDLGCNYHAQDEYPLARLRCISFNATSHCAIDMFSDTVSHCNSVVSLIVSRAVLEPCTWRVCVKNITVCIDMRCCKLLVCEPALVFDLFINEVCLGVTFCMQSYVTWVILACDTV